MAEQDALSLLVIARRDLRAARMLQDASIDESNWGFQVQQVVEKALKAWLYHLGDSPPFTHDLVLLFKRLLRAGVEVEAHRDLARFTDFAVQFRYDVDPEPMGLDRAYWLHRAEQLVDHVAALIGSEA
jgi:HEPN domain-containing protein